MTEGVTRPAVDALAVNTEKWMGIEMEVGRQTGGNENFGALSSPGMSI